MGSTKMGFKLQSIGADVGKNQEILSTNGVLSQLDQKVPSHNIKSTASCPSGVLLTIGATLLCSIIFVLFSKDGSQRLFASVGMVIRDSQYTVTAVTRMPRHLEASIGEGMEGTLSLGFSSNWRQETVPWLLKQIQENGSRECHHEQTKRALLFGLPSPSIKGPVRLRADRVHNLLLVSYTETGTRRCSGGDYYETDITGTKWKSRPPVMDMGDGSYLVRLQVDARFAGLYNFRANLLFTHFHGLEHHTEAWKQDKWLISFEIEFVASIDQPVFPPPRQIKSLKTPDLELCIKKDFMKRSWSGRWTKSKGNATCPVNYQGRYLCLDLKEDCEAPWCEGPLGSLESNGWVYSAHCGFHLYQREEAWKCVEGRWFFFWGDSNHQDTIRNLLTFVLGCRGTDQARISHKVYWNPQNTSQNVTFTNVFNGHYDESSNGLGLASLANQQFQQKIISLFHGNNSDQTRIPDAMVLNSGLHDGLYNWHTLAEFSAVAENAAQFWGHVLANISSDYNRPTVVYRTTVAPAGFVRGSPSNPQKMEAFNRVMVEKFLKKTPATQIVDAFDLTFPWHYDNNYSDGGHYGRPGNGRRYFTDLMLVHILLNALCPLS